MTGMLDSHELRALATESPGQPVLSVYVRTDPRDPANTSHAPAWQIELRNGLRAVGERLAGEGDRLQQRSFEKLRTRVERGLAELSPSERGRSVVWFLHADGETSRRLSLQLPVRRDAVVWDDRPFVSPLVDVVDRGAPTGVVLVGGDSIRVLQIQAGRIDEPDDSTYELSLGDWRPFKAYASANPARGQQTVSHQEHHEARVSEQRGKLFETAAAATAERAEGLGWERIIIAAEGQVAARFHEALPETLRSRVITTLDHNVGHGDLAAIAAILEPPLEAAWLERTRRVIAAAHERASAGAAGALGPQETLGALAEGRVDHLVLDPDQDFSSAAGFIPASIGGPPSMLAERAVEAAVAAGGRVSTLPVSDSEELLRASGMVALLRY
jgi:hypothetical protein